MPFCLFPPPFEVHPPGGDLEVCLPTSFGCLFLLVVGRVLAKFSQRSAQCKISVFLRASHESRVLLFLTFVCFCLLFLKTVQNFLHASRKVKSRSKSSHTRRPHSWGVLFVLLFFPPPLEVPPPGMTPGIYFLCFFLFPHSGSLTRGVHL